jgi:hypothetical protein
LLNVSEINGAVTRRSGAFGAIMVVLFNQEPQHPYYYLYVRSGADVAQK